jgi:hypothetical protein
VNVKRITPGVLAGIAPRELDRRRFLLIFLGFSNPLRRAVMKTSLKVG